MYITHFNLGFECLRYNNVYKKTEHKNKKISLSVVPTFHTEFNVGFG